MEQPGNIEGRHFTEYVADLDELKRSGPVQEYERLLWNCVEATEAEDSVEQAGVAPFYYEQLAILYRKQADIDAEIAVLERYAAQRHAPGVKPAKLMERLSKARTRHNG